MPELPEVHTVIATLAPRILHHRISAVLHLRDDMLTPPGFDLRRALAGRTIQSLTRRGKRIVFLLDDANTWFIHLGMTGRLTVEAASTPPPPHTHLILDLGTGQHLRFRDPRRFGQIRWLGESSQPGAMGPDAATIRASELTLQLGATRRAVKTALLDQRLIAGLGNIYVDESLFDARIHPLTLANRLTAIQITELARSIRKTLRRAIRHGGSTLRDYVDADGHAGAFQRLHRVYDRAGQPCRKCKTPIQRILVAGRGTCFCPTCQPRHKRKTPNRKLQVPNKQATAK